MPETITKYPDIVLEILGQSGMDCGTGSAQRILTTCPSERFCASEVGEICVFGLEEIPQMTQVSTQEVAQAVSASIYSAEILTIISIALMVGVFVGVALSRIVKNRI
jgi:ethanolamine utilization protein EutA (predicted chaperonin)